MEAYLGKQKQILRLFSSRYYPLKSQKYESWYFAILEGIRRTENQCKIQYFFSILCFDNVLACIFLIKTIPTLK